MLVCRSQKKYFRNFNFNFNYRELLSKSATFSLRGFGVVSKMFRPRPTMYFTTEVGIVAIADLATTVGFGLYFLLNYDVVMDEDDEMGDSQQYV